MIEAGRRSPPVPPGENRCREHGQRERSEGQAGLQRVVFERDLEKDRQRDHRAAQGDVLERLLGDPDPEVGVAEKVRVEQGRLSFAVAPHQPTGQRPERERADRDRQPDELAPLLPDQNPQDHAAHADDREDGPRSVDLAGAGVGDVADELDVEQDDRDHDQLEEEADPPREEGRHEAAKERPDRSRDGGRRRQPGHTPSSALALEVAADQRLHCGQQQGSAQAADDRPEDDDHAEALSQRHRQGAGRIAQQAQHKRALSPDQVADLAADQDERRRDQGLQRDRRLDTADGRIEIPDHGGDRDVHQRGVDDEHEHRHRENERQPRAARSLRTGGSRLWGHGHSGKQL